MYSKIIADDIDLIAHSSSIGSPFAIVFFFARRVQVKEVLTANSCMLIARHLKG